MIYTIFFQQLLFGILALLITYAIGKIIMSFYSFKGDYFFRLFVTNIIGITAIVLFYSLFKSGGKTINILLLPIVGYFLYRFRKYTQKPVFELNEIMKDCFWLITVFSIFFMYQSWFYFDFGRGEIKSLYTDYYCYASFTDSLKLWGNENNLTGMNYFFPNFRVGLIPYHYFELWITSFFSQLFGVSTLNSYYFITTTILTSIFFIGIFSMLARKIPNKIVLFIIASLLLCIGGISFKFYDTFEWLKYSFLFTDRSALTLAGSKFLPIYLYVILFYKLFKNDYKNEGLIALLCLPIFSIAFFPSIYGGILLYLIGKFVFNKWKISKYEWVIVLWIFVNIVLFAVFYSIFKSAYTDKYALNHMFNSGVFKGTNITNGLISIHNLKVMFCNFIYYSIPYIVSLIIPFFVFYGPFILFGYKHIKKHKDFWILLLAFVICGTIGSVFTKGLSNSIEFTTNITGIVVVYSVIGLASYLSSTFTIPILSRIFSLGLLSFLFFNTETLQNSVVRRNNYKYRFTEEKQTIAKISALITNKQTTVLIFLSHIDFDNRSYIYWHDVNDLYMLNQINKGTIIFEMGNPEICLKDRLKKLTYVESNYYHLFTPLNVWRSKGKGHDLKSFIDNCKIKYFYFKAGVEVPDYISKKAETIIESPTTHSRFIKIK